MAVYLRGNENCVRTYPRRVLATYYYLKARFPNGAIYPGFRPEVARRTGWRARTFFNKIAALTAAGLASKNENGITVLLPFAELVGSCNRRGVSHKCTVKADGSEREIRDVLLLKLFEEKCRQVSHATRKAEAATRIKGHGGRTRRAPADEVSVKAAKAGFVAMSVQSIAAHMDVSVSTVTRWKRRGTARRGLRQIDRTSYPSDSQSRAAMLNADAVGAKVGGAAFVNNGRLAVRMTSMYLPTAKYGTTVMQCKR